MSLMLDREYAPESEHAEKETFGRTAARVVLLSVVVTALIAGLYMAFGGSSGTDPLAGTANNSGAPAAAAKPAAVAPKPLTYSEKAVQLAGALPKAGTLDTGEKRAELIGYLKAVGIKVSAASSPATAASQGCDFLNAGYSPSKMVAEVASGGGYTRQQSKAFLLGASTLYCPAHAKNFR